MKGIMLGLMVWLAGLLKRDTLSVKNRMDWELRIRAIARDDAQEKALYRLQFDLERLKHREDEDPLPGAQAAPASTEQTT